MNVLFVQTGGTIDKDYPKGANSYHFEIKAPAIKRILDKTEPTFKWRIVTALQKDSLDIDHVDRQTVVGICREAAEDKIVVTHGTDTMRLTAEALESIPNKTIVLTGALRPERFSNSDADFNIGTALGALNFMSPGVYIAMSGRVLPWRNLQKDPETGNFHLVEDGPS